MEQVIHAGSAWSCDRQVKEDPNSALHRVVSMASNPDLDEDKLQSSLEDANSALKEDVNSDLYRLVGEASSSKKNDLQSSLNQIDACIAKGADPNYPDIWRSILLSPEVIHRLLDLGARGPEVLLCAQEEKNGSVVGILLACGVKAPQYILNPLLKMALQDGNNDSAKYLVRLGAIPSADWFPQKDPGTNQASTLNKDQLRYNTLVEECNSLTGSGSGESGRPSTLGPAKTNSDAASDEVQSPTGWFVLTDNKGKRTFVQCKGSENGD